VIPQEPQPWLCTNEVGITEIVLLERQKVIHINRMVGVSSPALLTVGCSPGQHLDLDAVPMARMVAPESMNCSKTFYNTTSVIVARMGSQTNMFHRFSSEWYPAFFIPAMFRIPLSTITFIRLDSWEPDHTLNEVLNQREGFATVFHSSTVPPGETWCFNTSWLLHANFYFNYPPGQPLLLPSSLPPFLSFWGKHMLELYGVKRRENKLKKEPPLLLYSERTNRRLLNIDEVIQKLAETTLHEGQRWRNHSILHSVLLGELPLEEQVRWMAKVDILVGMHGAGLTWIPLLEQGGAVVEIYPPLLHKPHYTLMSLAAGIKYYQYNLTMEDKAGNCDNTPTEDLQKKYQEGTWDGRFCDYRVNATRLAALILTAVENWYKMKN